MNFSELPISCYISTLNEERMIADVITSAKKICSEVLVIDSLSNKMEQIQTQRNNDFSSIQRR